MNLPDFDQDAMDRRFIAELDRLLAENVISSYVEVARVLGTMPGKISEIRSGRYHANHRMLYNLTKAYPTTDHLWVLFGTAATGRTEPATMPEPATSRGRPKLTR